MLLDDGEGRFPVEQSHRRGCVLASLLFNISFVRRLGEANVGEPALTTSLRGMFYADDAGVVSQSTEQLRKMLDGIVVMSTAFDLLYWRPRLRSCVYA